MKQFVVYRSQELYAENTLFVVTAENGERAMQKVCDILNDKYAVYEDFDGPPVDVNGSSELYSPQLDGFHYYEITSKSDVLQIL